MKPTSASIVAQSKVDLATLGFESASLDALVDEAFGVFVFYTGRDWDGGGAWTDSAVPEAMASAAVRRLVEVLAFQAQEDRAEAFGDFDLIQTFSASSYSETRRSADDFRKLGPLMIWRILGPLMTPAKRDDFVEQNGDALGVDVTAIPAFAVTEVGWSSNPGPFSYSNPSFPSEIDADPLFGS